MMLLRSALFNVVFFACTFVLCLYGVALRLFAPERALALVGVWSRTLLFAVRAICGIRFALSGLEHLPPGACLVASQHQSTFDTIVWPALVPKCCYVMKRELARLPLFGPLIDRAGMIVVDRAGGAAALRGLIRDGKRAAGEGRQIVIFPEGSRAEPGRPLPVQPGIIALAGSLGLPIVPVVTDSGWLWSRRAFRKRSGVIRIVILPPLAPDLQRNSLKQRLEELYRTGVPVDNSVGTPSGRLSNGRSRAHEPLEKTP